MRKQTSTPKAKVGKHTIQELYPASGEQQFKEKFAAKVGKQKDGQNSYVDSFLTLSDRVRATTRSFSFRDYVYCNRVMEIPLPELERLFTSFVKELESHGVIDLVHGCYDETVYIYR